MKTGKSLAKKITGGIVSVLFLSFVMVSCDKNEGIDMPADNNNPYALSGNASGSLMVPAVAGTGSGTFTGTYNPVNGQVIYTTSWSNLTGAPIAGGLYNGAAGTTGTGVDSSWTFESNAAISGTLTDTLVVSETQAAQLVAGTWYYVLKTTANSVGEIRGQITASR